MPDTPREKLLSPAFLALGLADLCYFSAAGVLLALTPLFVVGPLGSGEAQVGVTMGAFSVSTLVLRPVVGRWVDRYGRRPVLIGGAGLFAALTAVHLVVDSLALLVALRLLLGAAEALFFVAGFAAVADLAPPGRAGEALSLNSLALFLGIGIGPLIGQFLLRLGDFRAVWLGATVLAAMAVVMTLRVPETRKADAGSEPTPFIHRETVSPGLVLFIGVACMGGFLAFAVLHAGEVGLDAWSAVLLLFGAVVVGCRVVFRTLADRVPAIPLAGASLAALGVGLVVMGLIPTPIALLLGTAVTAVGAAFLTPAVFAAVFSRVEPAERGSAAATLSIFIDLGLGGGPMAVGLVAASSGTSAGLGAAGAVALGVALVVALRSRRPRAGVAVPEAT